MRPVILPHAAVAVIMASSTAKEDLDCKTEGCI